MTHSETTKATKKNINHIETRCVCVSTDSTHVCVCVGTQCNDYIYDTMVAICNVNIYIWCNRLSDCCCFCLISVVKWSPNLRILIMCLIWVWCMCGRWILAKIVCLCVYYLLLTRVELADYLWTGLLFEFTNDREIIATETLGEPCVLDHRQFECFTAEFSIEIGVQSSAHSLDDQQIDIVLVNGRVEFLIYRNGIIQ